MTQCQLKLRHSVTSLTQTLNYIRVAQRRLPVDMTLNQLTLKLSARVVLRHVNKLYNSEVNVAILCQLVNDIDERSHTQPLSTDNTYIRLQTPRFKLASISG